MRLIYLKVTQVVGVEFQIIDQQFTISIPKSGEKKNDDVDVDTSNDRDGNKKILYTYSR